MAFEPDGSMSLRFLPDFLAKNQSSGERSPVILLNFSLPFYVQMMRIACFVLLEHCDITGADLSLFGPGLNVDCFSPLTLFTARIYSKSPWLGGW